MSNKGDPSATGLGWLSDWYAEQCNGTWEHLHGIKLTSLDNPGWLLEVDLTGTTLADEPDSVVVERGEPPSSQNRNVGSSAWMRCEVKTSKFIGAGDARRLDEILAWLRLWLDGRIG